MSVDLWSVVSWWLATGFFGLVGWPIAAIIFPNWEDKGYLLAKAWGIIGTTYLVWILGSMKVAQFGGGTIVFSGILLAIIGIGIRRLWIKSDLKINWKIILAEELLFLLALSSWSYVKAHEPTINGLEKFMDYGFTKSILRTKYFPPQDMWYAGESINYYYFGHLTMATISKISGVGLEFGFNLMLATLFSFCLTMSFAIGRHLLTRFPTRVRVAGAILIALLVTLSGNLHTIYAFTTGYWGEEDNPPPFWQIMQPIWKGENITKGFEGYWYPNATRFIPYTIHEFPAYSFVVSDIHGHVLSIPIVLLLIALLVQYFENQKNTQIWQAGVYGLVAGTAFMTNALDGPIYIGLFGFLTIGREMQFSFKNIKLILNKVVVKNIIVTLGVTGGIFLISVLPFLVSFKPFVNGVAVNCPPAALANKNIGPIIFEGTEKCQKSPLWMMCVLWGFFAYCGVGLWLPEHNKDENRSRLLLWALYSSCLILFAEFFYFKDIYPQHFRSNTMFKLGYQAFIMMSIVSGYTVVKIWLQKKKSLGVKMYLLGCIPLLFLVMIFPFFAVRSYFNGLNSYRGLYGLSWMEEKYPDDFAAVMWLNKNISGQPVVLEASGDSYTDYERVSTFTGLPTVAGWVVHEWLWRGSYDPIAKRAMDVATIYESEDLMLTQALIDKYQVKYIVLGKMERERYANLNEEKISGLAKIVFSQGLTVIYQII